MSQSKYMYKNVYFPQNWLWLHDHASRPFGFNYILIYHNLLLGFIHQKLNITMRIPKGQNLTWGYVCDIER